MAEARGSRFPLPRRPGALRGAFVAAALAGCGGGDTDPPEPPWSGVTIESPSLSDRFTTDQPTVDLAGRSFVPAGSQCNAIIGTIAAGYRVRWRNAATAGAGSAGHLQLNCLLAVSLTWSAAGIPLAPGDNAITVTAEAADGAQGEDTIHVVHVPDAAAAP